MLLLFQVAIGDNNVTSSLERDEAACVTKFERVETIVHDTVYQRTCHQYHVSQCNVTKVPTTKDSLETRCIPSYHSQCRKVGKTVMRKECKTEHKAECFQVFIQVWNAVASLKLCQPFDNMPLHLFTSIWQLGQEEHYYKLTNDTIQTTTFIVYAK